MREIVAVTLIILLFVSGAVAQRPLEYSKERPILVDFDMKSIPEPASQPSSYLYDAINNSFFQPFKKIFDLPGGIRKLTGKRREAFNVNVLDEVPDSSWFTNRLGKREMSLDELLRGPDTDSGPADGILTVVRGKTAGITPGFQVRDSAGRLYLLKFDPKENPEMATGAEVISTKFFHAFGYNVPQNTIFHFTRDRLVVDPNATYIDELGIKRQMTEQTLEDILAKSPRRSDGSYRCVASKFLEGKPKGGFDFRDTRKDDPNDIIPHQDRRDLRGLRIFCAWLYHNDIRIGNTLDMYVTEGGRSFLRHYLIDFGSTLGSDTSFPNLRLVGRQYQVDLGEAMATFFSLGLHQPAGTRKAPPVRYPAVGSFDANDTKPQEWKQNFPLGAFTNMTDADGYWAARILSALTDEQIRAVVGLAEYSDPEVERYIAEQLIARRRMITDYYFSRTAAITRFRVNRSEGGARLEFLDLRGTGSFYYEIRPAEGGARIVDKTAVNGSSIWLSEAVLKKVEASGRRDSDRAVAEVRIWRRGESRHASVYLYSSGAETRIVGIKH